MKKRLIILLGIYAAIFTLFAGCVRTSTSVTNVSTMPRGEIAIKSITHDAKGVLKIGDKIHIKVEVENFDPKVTMEMGMLEIFARIANQPGEIILRNDGTLGDPVADDNFYEGEYIITEKSKRVADGKIVVNTYREEVFSEKGINIEP